MIRTEALTNQYVPGKYEDSYPNSFQEEPWFIDPIGQKVDGDIYTPSRLRKYFMKARLLGSPIDEAATIKLLRRPVKEYAKNKKI